MANYQRFSFSLFQYIVQQIVLLVEFMGIICPVFVVFVSITSPLPSIVIRSFLLYIYLFVLWSWHIGLTSKIRFFLDMNNIRQKTLKARRLKKRRSHTYLVNGIPKSGANGQASENEVQESFDLMQLPYSSIQPTFDYYLVSDHFPSFINITELDLLLKDAIFQRLNQVIPHQEEITGLMQTVTKLLIILDHLKVSPQNIDACKIESYHVVGSLRMGTLIKDHQIADITLVLHTLPVKAAISALGNKLLEEFQRIEPTNPYQISLRDDRLELTNIFNKDIVRILVATTQNLNKLDREIHIRRNAVQRHLRAIAHVQWFENNIKCNKVKNLIRLMKDVCKRFKEFSYFSPWMIIVLCQYSMNNSESCLPIHMAFKRIMQILSSGIFLPYSSGITDPCEPKMPIHGKLSVFDQEIITCRAQSLLRLLNYRDGCRYIFGLDSSSESLSPPTSIYSNMGPLEPISLSIDDYNNPNRVIGEVLKWENVIFKPSVSVFEQK